ncbi:sigma factor [Brevundimonas sp. NPDC058933]|uniref:sigma factor n=1 Tax=Brevundimonas sp. NPDC058933 TaxID=3346673 RepID=UPI003BEEF202
MKVRKSDLLQEIWKSKLSYCLIIEPAFVDPDVSVSDLSEVTIPNLTVRLDTDSHLPRAAVAGKGNLGHLEGEVSFDPFILYRSYRDDAGKLAFRETARSHQRAGSLTPTLARLITAMAHSYARRGNWRNYTYVDDMVQEALLNLVLNVLKFNENKSDNPHAYITRCLQTSFIRELNNQKKQGKIKDILLIAAGQTPSYGADDHLQ